MQLRNQRIKARVKPWGNIGGKIYNFILTGNTNVSIKDKIEYEVYSQLSKNKVNGEYAYKH